MQSDKTYYGQYGGTFVPEALMPAIDELVFSFKKFSQSESFNIELDTLLKNYVGRPTPLTYCPTLSQKLGLRLYLKREDLAHTGAHKINNAIGQALLAKYMGKRRVIAETGAGQHGVATATAAAKLGLDCEIYMGSVDMKRQELNVFRMRLLGAKVTEVKSGSQTLKDAINDAMRDWSSTVKDTHYLIGTVLGPAPYPEMVARFQSVIGRESRDQIIKAESRLPDIIVACVGGGSNAMGIFRGFEDDNQVSLVGVEAGGLGIASGKHAARFSDKKRGRIGILHGNKTFVLQDKDGQVMNTHSISAGLDYSAVGPEHAHFRDIARAKYSYASDKEALSALKELSGSEGIIPALESAHAIAYVIKNKALLKGKLVLVNLSGRGDKDMGAVSRILGN